MPTNHPHRPVTDKGVKILSSKPDQGGVKTISKHEGDGGLQTEAQSRVVGHEEMKETKKLQDDD